MGGDIMTGKKLMMCVIIGVGAGMIMGNVLKVSTVETFGNHGITILLDAGHGSPDGGTTGVDGTVEKDINLKIALKTQEVLEGKGIHVLMTRDDDKGLQDEKDNTIREMKVSDMNKRLDIMKKSNADLFLSIHMNSFPSKTVSGLRIFYSKEHEAVKMLAEDMQINISKVTGAKSYAVKTADEKLFLMKNPPMPAILAECGFLSNPEEEKLLNDEKYQSKIAWAIADAIEKYYINR